MGCDLCGASVGCGDGAVGWTGGHNQGEKASAPEGRPLAHLVDQDRVSCKRRMWALLLPGFMGHRVVGIDGEVVGLVGVVLVIGVEGADPNLLLGRQVVDLDRLAGKRDWYRCRPRRHQHGAWPDR